MSDLIFHIGYPKAGSTTLQKSVFQSLPHVQCLLPENHPKCILSSKEVSAIQQLWKQPFSDEKDELILIENAKSVIDDLTDDAVYVVSSENIQLIHTKPHLDLVLTRCKAAFGLPYVVLVNRDPVDLLRSLYDMHPFDSFSTSGDYVMFDSWLDSFFDPKNDNKLRGYLNINNTTSELEKIFGIYRVHVLEFDSLFKRKSSDHIGQLAELLKISSTELVSLLSQKQNKLADHQLSHLSRRLLGAFHLSDYLPSSIVRRLARKLTALLVALGLSKPPTSISAHASWKIREFYSMK